MILLSLLLASSYLLRFLIVVDSSPQISGASEQATFENGQNKIMEAYGRIANNQIQNGSVSWIQAGLWYLTISDNNNGNNKSAYFYTDFSMVRPDGSSMHKHSIENFKSTTINLEGERIIIRGIADIDSGNSQDYQDIPIIVNLKDNTVLGLIIDIDKTQQHFASSNANEIFGILIDSRSLANLII
jgi:hypothetical protein